MTCRGWRFWGRSSDRRGGALKRTLRRVSGGHGRVAGRGGGRCPPPAAPPGVFALGRGGGVLRWRAAPVPGQGSAARARGEGWGSWAVGVVGGARGQACARWCGGRFRGTREVRRGVGGRRWPGCLSGVAGCVDARAVAAGLVGAACAGGGPGRGALPPACGAPRSICARERGRGGRWRACLGSGVRGSAACGGLKGCDVTGIGAVLGRAGDSHVGDRRGAGTGGHGMWRRGGPRAERRWPPPPGVARRSVCARERG